MGYRINFYLAGQLTGTEIWDGPTFEDAKAHAINAVELQVADRAEIRNKAGVLVFHHPRITRRA